MTTKKAPSLLHPGPWLSAGLLLVASGTSFGLGHLIAQTAGLAGVSSPRMTALVGLAMIASPIVLVAVAHHAMQRVLDRMAGEKTSHGAWPGLTSWWTGTFAWLTASLVTTVLLLGGGLVDAGNVVPSVANIFVRNSLMDLVSWPALFWVGGAGALYMFERRAKHVFATAKEPAAAAPWKFYAASLARAVVLTAVLAQLVVGALVLGIVAIAAAGRASHGIAGTFGALFVLSPVLFVAFGDHGMRHILRLVGLHRQEGLGGWPSVQSWWTGLYSWFVLAFGGIATFALHQLLFGGASHMERTTMHPFRSTTIVFVVIATALFHLEACVRRRLATRGE